ncbi:MAG: alkaline phosphatase family protein [Ignavibacteriales bacterium]|nr:alkaline phosphatase family protein [Ignavibacteriales bacterium]
MSIALLFLDGVGIGSIKNELNPFTQFQSKYFTLFSDGGNSRCAYDGIIIPTNPFLDVEGLPQSATGQTAIFTGINASKEMGRHVSGFPTPTLRKIIAEHSIMLQLKKIGLKSTFANGYTPQYFERSQQFWSASTWVMKAAEVPFRWLDDINNDKAVSPDLTNEFIVQRGLGNVQIRTAKKAGEIIGTLLEENDFVLYEHPFSDKIGHEKNMEAAIDDIKKLDGFLAGLLSSTDLSKHTILLTSDHGNIEDLSIDTHTKNNVPTIVWGKQREYLVSKISSLLDITPTIVSSFQFSVSG